MIRNYVITVGALAGAVFFGTYIYFQRDVQLHDPFVENETAFKLPKRDRIDLAMKHEFDKTHDPKLGYIPKERLREARDFMNEKVAARKKSGISAKAMTLAWTERGPNNVGGRTRALAWDPNDIDNTKVWAGAVTGGLWYNDDVTDNASEWQAVNDAMENLSISAITFDPNTTTTMYIGTGEGHQIGSTRGDGVFKSTDGGTTWTQLTAANGFYATDEDFHYVNDITVVDEAGSSVLYVGTQTSVSDYENSDYATSGENGLWRSEDGGVTFTQVLPNYDGGSEPFGVADIEVNSSGRIYVGTAVSNGGGRILYSDDDGSSWTETYDFGTDGRVELATAPSDDDIVYAIGVDGIDVADIIKSANATSTFTWSTLSRPAYKDQSTCTNSTDDFCRGQAWYDLIMVVHPTNSSIVVMGGIDLYKTTNGGTSFGLISYWTGGCDTEVHADQHAIAFNPNDVDAAIFGNDGGVYYSSDVGSASNPTISARNNGYNVTQFYGTAIHPTSGTDYYLAGAQDNGSQQFSSAGVNSTVEVSGGDGAFCNIDQNQSSYQWTQYVYNTYYRSTDGGSSFSGQINLGSSNGRFINPSRYDNTQNIMYMCYDADTYLRWSNPQSGSTTTSVAVGEFDGEQVSAITVSPNTSNRVFFGTGGSGVFIVDNANSGSSKTGTGDITDITGSNFPSAAYVSNIEVETGDDNHILAVFSNYGVTSIFETTDGGSTWTSVEGDLPDMPVRWAVFHPQDAKRVFLATDLGVWSTDNLNGASTFWEPSTEDGLPNVRTDMLLYRTSDYEMVAATHGRGLFTADITISTASTPEISFADAGIYFTEATANSSSCRNYTDLTVTLEIAQAPSGQADVSVNVNGGSTTATEYSDYEFIGSQSVSFPDGDGSDQSVTIRIYDDTELESLEQIELSFSISGTTDAVSASDNTTHTIKINDNDVAPVNNADEFEIWSESFDSPTGWTTVGSTKSGGSKSAWLIGQGCGQTITGTTRLVGQITAGGSAACDYVKDGSADGIIIYKTVNAADYHDMRVEFNWMAQGEVGQDYGSLLYSTDGGGSWTVVGSELSGTGYTINSADQALPTSLDGTSFLLGWRWLDDNDATQVQPALAVDNIIVYGQTNGDGVADAVSDSDDQYLGPFEEVYFRDGVGEIIARIENTSGHDYGCTTVSVDRDGTGTSEFWSTDADQFLMNKTVFVTPTTNNVSGTYTITLYYTEAEVNGWLAATSNTVNDLTLAKTAVAINTINSSSPIDYDPEVGTGNVVENFGTDYAITASFTTGFSGIGAGNPGAVPLPLTLLTFNAKTEGDDVKLTWVSSLEENTDVIEIEHSIDGLEFYKIGDVDAAGNSNEPKQYSFIHKGVSYGQHYYRLKTIDNDDSFEYSWVVNAFQNKSIFDIISISPQPASEFITINYASDNDEQTEILILNLLGRLVYEGRMPTYQGVNSKRIDLGNLKNGVYILSVTNKGRVNSRRIVIQ